MFEGIDKLESRGLNTDRRGFLKTLGAGAAALTAGAAGFGGASLAEGNKAGRSRVSFQLGTDHRDVIAATLQPLQEEVGTALEGKKNIIIKVNMGQVVGPLNATHPDTVMGILDFLKPITRKRITVAESTAGSGRSTLDGFKNFQYDPILKQHKAKFVDLNTLSFSEKLIQDADKNPLAINVIDTFTDPDTYMISATRIKSHNCVIATLSLKNVTMAAPVNHFKRSQAKGRNEKGLMHSGGNRGLSYNMLNLAKQGVVPDLAVLDGVVGMEGDGPVWGTPVEHGVALASTDWLAADRVGVELMGMIYDDVMYLKWCGEAGLGIDNLDNIDIVGPNPWSHVRNYRYHKNFDKQMEWLLEDRAKKA